MSKEIIERVRGELQGIINRHLELSPNEQLADDDLRDKILSHPNIVIIDPTKQAIIDLESLRKLTESQKE